MSAREEFLARINVIADNALVSGFAAQAASHYDATGARGLPRLRYSPRREVAIPQPSNRKPKTLSSVLTKSDEGVLDSAVAIWPALRARGEKISNWAAPALGALGYQETLKERTA